MCVNELSFVSFFIHPPPLPRSHSRAYKSLGHPGAHWDVSHLIFWSQTAPVYVLIKPPLSSSSSSSSSWWCSTLSFLCTAFEIEKETINSILCVSLLTFATGATVVPLLFHFKCHFMGHGPSPFRIANLIISTMNGSRRHPNLGFEFKLIYILLAEELVRSYTRN